MGLLDDLFRKDSLNQLKKQVTEKNEAIARAESEIAEKTINLTNLETRLTALNATISDRQTAIESLKSALDKSQTENRRKTLEIEKLRAFALDQNTQADNQILILKNSLAKASAETEAATIARKSIEKSWHEAQESYDAKDRLLQEREEKYTEKLEKLLINRQRFQQTSAEFHSRLQNWKQNVEPQLQKYEQHLSLDSRQLRIQEAMSRLEELRASITAREDDLVRRDCTDKALTSREAKVSAWNKTLTNQQDVLEKKLEEVRRKKIEQDERTLKLENWARELFAFRNRVNQLDNEIIALAKQKKDFESNEAIGQSQNSERLADLQRKQSTLKALENRIGEREEYLNAREITINQAGSHIISLKQDNVSLRRELGEITARAENLEASNREYLSKTSRLTRKNELLQANYAAMNERLKSTTGTNRFNSSLANVKVLSWLLESGNPDAAKIANGWLGSTGTGPWNSQTLEPVLEEIGYQFYSIPDSDLENLVVGRKGWSKTSLLAQIEAREGEPLRIYSQEMLFAKLVTGKDPFDANDDELLDAFASDHPALQFLLSLPEPWPTVSGDRPEAITEVNSEDLGVSESPLHILGYRVGATSDLSIARRREILMECFASRNLVFSEDSDDAYIAKWGRGGGPQRLYRMAAHIKSLADGRVGKDYRKPQARLDWVSDLKWLKEKYFSNYKTKFSWP
jgi:hypothetical protein